MVADALPPDVEARFLAPASFDSIVIGEGGSTREEARAGDLLSLSQIFAILLMVSVLTGSGYLLESVSDEKEDRMIEVLLTSVSPMGLLAGKVIAMGALGLAQALVWAGSLALAGPRVLAGLPGVTQIEVDPLFLAWLAAFFLAGYMVLAVVMAGIGAATSSYREGSQIAVLVYLPAVSPMVAFQLIGADADGGLARVLSFIPVTAPLTMILRMGSTEVPLAEAVASLAVTVLGGLAMLWVSARVFRAGLLLVGQRMTLASVFRALRQAG
jgi:ABC-2 type transport system permease protein